MRIGISFTLAIGLLFGPQFGTLAQELNAPEAARLIDEAPVVISGLAPGSEVILRSERPSHFGSGIIMRSDLRYIADDQGNVETANMAAQGDAELAPQGNRLVFAPFWKMASTGDKVPEDWPINEVRFSVDIEADGSFELFETMRLGPGPGDYVEQPLSAEFPGAFIATPVDRPSGDRPVVIVLGGSEGDDGAARALTPSFIEEGWIVLGLPYHSPRYYGQDQKFPGLPGSFFDIPIDYVEAAIGEIKQREGVNPDRVAIWGASKGAELALLTGSRVEGLQAIVGIVPSDVVWEGWGAGSVEGESTSFAYRGESLAFVPYVDMRSIFAKLSRGEPAALRPAMDAGRIRYPERVATARIEVEQIDEPVLLVGGDLDDVWASGPMARNIAESRDRAGLETIALTYPDGSHSLSGSPFDPGSPADATARQEAYPAMRRFLRRALTTCTCE